MVQTKILALGWYKIEFQASITINRHLRGHYIRKKYSHLVARIKNAGAIVKYTKAVLVIQKYARGYIIRNILRRMNRAASYIQGY